MKCNGMTSFMEFMMLLHYALLFRHEFHETCHFVICTFIFHEKYKFSGISRKYISPNMIGAIVKSPIIFGEMHFLLILKKKEEMKCDGMTHFMEFIC